MLSQTEQICSNTEQHLQCQTAEQASSEDDIRQLLAKESRAAAAACHHHMRELAQRCPSLATSRSQAVGWILKVVELFLFSSHTAFLAVNYFDRFLARSGFLEGKSWMIQLAAVACLSLAAKMEETNVPLLVDFQVEEAKYVFEAKTIQKMEILVLSTLNWEMNAVTPMLFVDGLMRRFGFTDIEIPSSCEELLLHALTDIDFVRFRSSVMAAAAMLNVISKLQSCIPIQSQNQLFQEYDMLELNECCSFLQLKCQLSIHNRRVFSEVHDSPKGVLDASFNT